MIAIPRLARRARRVIEAGQEVWPPLRQDRSRWLLALPACLACLGGVSRGRCKSSAVSAAVGPQAMARQGALAQNGLAQLARPDSTDATHIFQCPLVLPSLLLIDGDRRGLRRQDGTLETALLRCFCAFDIWCQVCMRVGASAPLTALVYEASATFAATRQKAALIRQDRAHSRCPGWRVREPADRPAYGEFSDVLAGAPPLGRCPSAHATTLAHGTPVGELC